ncbi:MAG: aldo/keto reductase [Desulfobacterales bacterium]
MERRRFGGTDMDVSVLGFGSSEIGFQGTAEETVSRLLNEALDQGLNVIDTAECYLTSEALIGNTISHRRDDYFLFTKCGHPDGLGSEDWSISGILSSIQRSLRRLKTDCVDLVLLHTCSEQMLRQGDVIEALQQARDRGYTRYIGYSGDRMEMKYAIECGAFDAIETSMSIADQQPLTLTLPLAKERNLGVIIKRPIANAAWKASQEPVNPYVKTYRDRLAALVYDFLKEDLQTSVGVALRFTAAGPGVHTLIVGTTKPGRWQENATLLEAGPLANEEAQKIHDRWKEVADDTWIGES